MERDTLDDRLDEVGPRPEPQQPTAEQMLGDPISRDSRRVSHWATSPATSRTDRSPANRADSTAVTGLAADR